MVSFPKWVNLTASIPSTSSFDTTQAAGTPININAQTGQGYYRSTAGVVVPFSGLTINVRAFGAVGDGVTNDGAAFLAAFAYINAIALTGSVYGYPGRSAPKLFVPAGRYFLGTTTLDFTTTFIFEGESCGGSEAAQSTVLIWSAGATGLRVQANNTSGATTSGLVLATSGAGSIIRNFELYGGYNGANDADFHGIHLRARATIQDVFIDKFQGNGIHIIADAAANNGNANNWRAEHVVVQNCRNGIKVVASGDVNAGYAIAISGIVNREYGIDEGGFLGNTYIACHSASNTLGAYRTTNANGRNVFLGCYSESGQPAASFVYPTMVVGGFHAAGVTGVSWLNAEGILQATGDFKVGGALTVSGSNSLIGPNSSPGSDNSLFLDNTNFNSFIIGRQWTAGVPTTIGLIDFHYGFGLDYDVGNAGWSHRFLINGAIAATISSTGLAVTGVGAFTGGVSGTIGTFSAGVSGTTGTFSAGVSGTTGIFSSNVTATGYKVGAVQVVGAQGAAVADSAAFTSVNATNAAANPPTQTEFNNFVAEFNKLRTDTLAIRTQLNLALARLRAATGHGLIA